MPMFREDGMGRRDSTGSDAQKFPDSAPIPIQSPSDMGTWFGRRLSEESIRTELCDGPVPDSPPRPATPQDALSRAVSDRAELIERLKRGESPTWVPNRHLESLLQQDKSSSPPRTPRPSGSPSSGLLPAPTITPEKHDTDQAQQSPSSPLREGLDIERPRSALHSGNFTPAEHSPEARAAEDAILPESNDQFRSPPAGWISTSPPAGFALFDFAQGVASYRKEAFRTGPSSLSSSLSSSFVYKPPTSPLVQSESNEDLDLTLPLHSFNIDAGSPRNSRRHTLNFGHSPFSDAAGHRQTPLRRESTYPYQAHQPRRSLNSTPSFPLTGVSPQTPFLRTRRPSIGLEASPLQHASMVGSYEESILRGRMSTTPSKPLEFTAQIGVLGLGKCKANLRCPAHVSLPFSAVFYNYATTTSGGVKVEDGPSPYVGQIDLENGLPNPEEGQRTRRKLQSRYQDLKGATGDSMSIHDAAPEVLEGEGASKTAKPKRASRSPKGPPGGGYRIPEKGQLQIIIKNQNKTAVKLYLVPYDLAGMEPGTKTFIRQRSYSAGPIIETELPVSQDAPATGTDRPTLRYLIHLHICCPSKGRYYLYKSIRVVFANRVPDGKERLRNEVTYPDPRFTPYKPIRVMHPQPASPNAAHAQERDFQRRSAGFVLGRQLQLQEQEERQHLHHVRHRFHTPDTPYIHAAAIYSAALPIRREAASEVERAPATVAATASMPSMEMTGPSPPTSVSTFRPPNTTTSAYRDPLKISSSSSSSTKGIYDKLNRSDARYGGGHHRHNSNNVPSSDKTNNGIPNSRNVANDSGGLPFNTVAEGLLSKRLRSLGVEQHHHHHHQQDQ